VRRRIQSTTSASTSVCPCRQAAVAAEARSHSRGTLHSADTGFRTPTAGTTYEEQQRQQASPPFSQPMDSRKPATSARSYDRMHGRTSPRQSLFASALSLRSTWLAAAIAARECAAMRCSPSGLVEGVQRLCLYIHVYPVSLLHSAQYANMPSNRHLPYIARSEGVLNHCRYKAAMISPASLRLKNSRSNKTPA